ncbi:hypothetical protein HHK36_012370 [Tetracentron sinense]|uniref:RING-type E3 ubiquitin transferase n=1 Tax=Tetracentron sinense TaxID=13715 RepID=A0A835DFN4_TETSI|nr:hypothetical protein HHK36_012370 [Tetracentron sinense]
MENGVFSYCFYEGRSMREIVEMLSDLVRIDHFSEDSDSLSSQVPSTSNTPSHVLPPLPLHYTRRIHTDHSAGTDTLLYGTPEAPSSPMVHQAPSEIVDPPLRQSIRILVIFIVCLHIYARWFLLRARRRNLHRRNRTHLLFHAEPTVSVASRGLDASLLKSLPVFVYSSNTHDEVVECAVCLSEFEENEKGRCLPKCSHSFHIDCIDMWFHSHSTCPLCRAPVNPEISVPVTETPVDIVISISESEAASSSGFYTSCQRGEDEMVCSSSSSSSSLGSRRKPLESVSVSIEVPRREENLRGLQEGQRLGSPVFQGLKSPGSRILSLKRILSRDRKEAPSPSSENVLNCSSAADTNLQGGGGGSEQAGSQPTRFAITISKPVNSTEANGPHLAFVLPPISHPLPHFSGPPSLRDTSQHINQFLETETDPYVQQCLNDCSENYLDAIEQIDDSLAALDSKGYNDVNTWVTAAMSDAESCEQGFKDGASHVSVLHDKNAIFGQLCSNALAITNLLAGV